MAPHHTKDKGDLAQAKVTADLIERGATVLLPLTEHAPFDVVAYLHGAFHRVQVKYRTATRGSVSVQFKSIWSDRNGIHRRPMPRDEVDVVAIYTPATNECYYFNPSHFGQSISLRIAPTRNGQAANINLASKYRVMPPLPLADGQ